MSDTSQLQAVADRLAISDVLYRYCRAVDRLDQAEGHAVFHEDAEADYGEGFFVGSGRGAVDAIIAAHRHAVNHTHQVTNVIIELGGDRAASESYVVSALRVEREGKLMEITTWGRYLDQWSRRAGKWAIDKRLVIMDLDAVAEVNPLSPAGKSRGRRDPGDPSYAILGQPG